MRTVDELLEAKRQALGIGWPMTAGEADLLFDLLYKSLDELQAAQQDQARARVAALEEACRVVCPDCAKGKPVEIGGPGKHYFDTKVWYHSNEKDLMFWMCNASTIRQLMTRP